MEKIWLTLNQKINMLINHKLTLLSVKKPLPKNRKVCLVHVSHNNKQTFFFWRKTIWTMIFQFSLKWNTLEHNHTWCHLVLQSNKQQIMKNKEVKKSRIEACDVQCCWYGYLIYRHILWGSLDIIIFILCILGNSELK